MRGETVAAMEISDNCISRKFWKVREGITEKKDIGTFLPEEKKNKKKIQEIPEECSSKKVKEDRC